MDRMILGIEEEGEIDNLLDGLTCKIEEDRWEQPLREGAGEVNRGVRKGRQRRDREEASQGG